MQFGKLATVVFVVIGELVRGEGRALGGPDIPVTAMVFAPDEAMAGLRRSQIAQVGCAENLIEGE